MTRLLLLAALLAACSKAPTGPSSLGYSWAILGPNQSSTETLNLWFGPADSLGGHVNRWISIQPGLAAGGVSCQGVLGDSALLFAWLGPPSITDSMVSTLPVTVPSFARSLYLHPGPRPVTGAATFSVAGTATNSLEFPISEPWPCSCAGGCP
jgi:hypothetical protein